MPFALLEMTIVNLAVLGFLSTITLYHVIHPASLIYSTAVINHLSLAMPFIITELAFVEVTVRILELAVTMVLVALPLTIIERLHDLIVFVREEKFAATMPFALFKLTLIDLTIRCLFSSMAMSLTVYPVTKVYLTA